MQQAPNLRLYCYGQRRLKGGAVVPGRAHKMIKDLMTVNRT